MHTLFVLSVLCDNSKLRVSEPSLCKRRAKFVFLGRRWIFSFLGVIGDFRGNKDMHSLLLTFLERPSFMDGFVNTFMRTSVVVFCFTQIGRKVKKKNIVPVVFFIFRTLIFGNTMRARRENVRILICSVF